MKTFKIVFEVKIFPFGAKFNLLGGKSILFGVKSVLFRTEKNLLLKSNKSLRNLTKNQIRRSKTQNGSKIPTFLTPNFVLFTLENIDFKNKY